MKTYRYLMTAVILLVSFVCISQVSAKNKLVPKIYAFGFSASFNDSTVYFTDVQEVDSVWINDKNGFLLNRADYSYQLKNYFDGKSMPHRTCMIMFALKPKKIDKMYKKMKNKYTKKGNFDVKYISSNEFRFKAVTVDQ